MNSNVLKLLNEQIDKEGYSSYLYLSMASWADGQGLPGIAAWLYAQSDEEREHMLKIIRFVNERGESAVVPGHKTPPASWKDVPTLFAEVLSHEQYVTASINNIADACLQNKDYTTFNWIQWFVSEQIEEESNAQGIMDYIRHMSPNGLLLLDKQIMKMRGEE